jgi:phenylpyruvate tautomerase PptA (4-oxalocrotonate tautomerase family)
MPLVKIEISEGSSRKKLIQLQRIVMDSVVTVLQLPENDRNIRLIEYKPEFFSMKNPYEILIEISLFKGRTFSTKKLLYQTITDNLQELGIRKEQVFILLNEQPLENWGVRGGFPASEIKIGFKVEL